jgi:hypothetical protein
MCTVRTGVTGGILALLMGCGHTLHEIYLESSAESEVRLLHRDVDSIWLTSGEIEAPHRELAVISTPPLSPELLQTVGLNELRLRAHQIGAHSVVRVQALPQLTEEITYRPGNLTRVGTRWVTHHRLTGVAVVFEDPAPDRWPIDHDLNIPPAS